MSGGGLKDTVMKVTVKFTTLFKIYSGVDQVEMDIAEGATVDDLSLELVKKYPKMALDSSQAFFAVNERISPRDQILADGDQVRVFQTLAGG